MRRTEVTYGQLDCVLRALGFSCRLVTDDPPAWVYEHESGAILTTPPYPRSDFVLAFHLVAARTTADLFGIADPNVFDAKLRKAGLTRACGTRLAIGDGGHDE